MLGAGGEPSGADSPSPGALELGRSVYERYCYQCHGYAGDARTLASSFLAPPPRDFSRTAREELPRGAMLSAVTSGREGTAMVSFRRILSPAQIEAVVDYVRSELLAAPEAGGRYHTAANGWPNHERYASAFPFASGEIPMDSPWEELAPAQQEGRRLYLAACVSCHDRGRVRDQGPAWDLDAVSYPRAAVPSGVDSVSSASPYAAHRTPPSRSGLSDTARRGRRLFLDNCAFCHAADGTGRNWIGSFLRPHARDLTSPGLIASLRGDRLRDTIREGIPGTSMPAWRDVLTEGQIADLAAYLQEALGEDAAPGASPVPGAAVRASAPLWQRAAPARR